MAVASVRAKLTEALLEALGLDGKQVVSLSLHLAVDKCITADVKLLVDDPQHIGKLLECVGAYTLEPAAQFGACDVCGKPATSKVRDSHEVATNGEYIKWMPGEIRARCDEHFEPSVTYELDS